MTNRRQLFRMGGLMAAVHGLGGRLRTLAAAPLEITNRLYQSIGVRPLINARGTFTIITGSQTLPEVKKAMEEASRHFVQMDELMDGVGKRLSEITGAEWGIVTNGCCAAITHFTAASIAGRNPERMQRLPNLAGLKNEVIIPSYSRNVYDHAVRMLGTTIIEVKDRAELEAAFNERTAMVYILGGPGDDGPLGTRVIAEVAKKHKVPVLVDAAAEILTIKPNVHLERGATAVAYSGGKCIRGPQAAGLLLGNKEHLQAAWINSAPHHAFGRSLKVGKEEIMGMLAAVEMWIKRDHKAEWKAWEAQLEHIGSRVSKVQGVSYKINQPSEDLSNRSPRLNVTFDSAKLGITGQDIMKLLLDTEPRINLAGAQTNSFSIIPYQMQAGDEKPIADRLFAVLSSPPKIEHPQPPQGTPAMISGQWEVRLDFGPATTTHTLLFEQTGDKLQGSHRGQFYSGDLTGSVAANTVKFRSSHRAEGTRLGYAFSGSVEGDKMTGTVDLGEYGSTTWTATRHKYHG